MAKREPHWMKLFLRELGRTGNVRVSAERAGVDFSTAYQRRKRHGEFAQAWEGALAAFALRHAQDEREGELAPPAFALRQAQDEREGELAPPAFALRHAQDEREGEVAASAFALRHVQDERCPSLLPHSRQQGGAELVSRPDGKLIKGSEARWGKRVEGRFLNELTVSANVRLAARAAGFSTAAVYKRRIRDQWFAAAWDSALETGKARVQAYLIEAVTRTFDPDELPIEGGHEMPKVSIGEAINIARLKGPGEGRARQARSPGEAPAHDIEGARRRLEARMAGLRRREEREMTERGWSKHVIPVARREGEEPGTVWLPPGWRIVGPGRA